eukprot:TRINITY_DN232_c0_g1_i4.p1 TRINITY_DN232_c0_g1~~TRINITY_DN232_c0_g1_i4.p1  ORF type:complete len:670 (+),score=317.56 TRINITY_DN232_c0_g1_i4:71-2080(+)
MDELPQLQQVDITADLVQENNDLREWVEDLAEHKFNDKEAWLDECDSGIVFCKMAMSIEKGLKLKYSKMAKIFWMKRDNVLLFVQWLREKLEPSAIFDIQELLEQENTTTKNHDKVRLCLAALAEWANENHGTDLPGDKRKRAEAAAGGSSSAPADISSVRAAAELVQQKKDDEEAAQKAQEAERTASDVRAKAEAEAEKKRAEAAEKASKASEERKQAAAAAAEKKEQEAQEAKAADAKKESERAKKAAEKAVAAMQSALGGTVADPVEDAAEAEAAADAEEAEAKAVAEAEAKAAAEAEAEAEAEAIAAAERAEREDDEVEAAAAAEAREVERSPSDSVKAKHEAPTKAKKPEPRPLSSSVRTEDSGPTKVISPSNRSIKSPITPGLDRLSKPREAALVSYVEGEEPDSDMVAVAVARAKASKGQTYKHYPNDEIDQALEAEMLHKQHELDPENMLGVVRVRKGQYLLLPQKKLFNMRVVSGNLMVRVGGGFVPFDQWYAKVAQHAATQGGKPNGEAGHSKSPTQGVRRSESLRDSGRPRQGSHASAEPRYPPGRPFQGSPTRPKSRGKSTEYRKPGGYIAPPQYSPHSRVSHSPSSRLNSAFQLPAPAPRYSSMRRSVHFNVLSLPKRRPRRSRSLHDELPEYQEEVSPTGHLQRFALEGDHHNRH